MTQDNDGIELVMCQTNGRPEKHAEEMKTKKKRRGTYVICRIMEVISFLTDTTC
jgi:hypothetical protein